MIIRPTVTIIFGSSETTQFIWLFICCVCVCVVFVYNACELYQAGERGHVHADGHYAAGEAQLVKPSVSFWENRGEVEPTAGQNHPCCYSLGCYQPLKHKHTH